MSFSRRKKGPLILTDNSYKDSIIHYRFGHFLNFSKDSFSIEIQKLLFDDERKIHDYKPKKIRDLFENSPKTSDKRSDLRGYKVLLSLSQSNYGGNYLADKEGTKYILKEARPNLRLTSLHDPIARRKHEIKIARRVIDKIATPKFVESFYFKRHFFAVFNFIQGLTLFQWKGSLTFIYPFNREKRRKKEIEIFLNDLIDSFVKILLDARSINVILNDIKLDNFILQNNGKLFFIDLDCSFIKGRDEIRMKDKFFKETPCFTLDTKK